MGELCTEATCTYFTFPGELCTEATCTYFTFPQEKAEKEMCFHHCDVEPDEILPLV